MKKTRSKKSRDTVPLNGKFLQNFFFHFFTKMLGEIFAKTMTLGTKKICTIDFLQEILTIWDENSHKNKKIRTLKWKENVVPRF
jgi:hypothetical protein